MLLDYFVLLLLLLFYAAVVSLFYYVIDAGRRPLFPYCLGLLAALIVERMM